MNGDKKPMPKEYGEMIYSFLAEMNGAFMTQLRTLNNGIGNIQRNLIDLTNAVNVLVTSLKETRDKRYQEEIDNLEAQMETLRRQLEEKKISKSTSLTTSEKIEAVTNEVLERRELEEHKRRQIDWIDVRNKVLIVIITAIVMAILQMTFGAK